MGNNSLKNNVAKPTWGSDPGAEMSNAKLSYKRGTNRFTVRNLHGAKYP